MCLPVASEKLLKMDAGQDQLTNTSPSDAVKAFLLDCKVRNLGSHTRQIPGDLESFGRVV